MSFPKVFKGRLILFLFSCAILCERTKKPYNGEREELTQKLVREEETQRKEGRRSNVKREERMRERERGTEEASTGIGKWKGLSGNMKPDGSHRKKSEKKKKMVDHVKGRERE